MQQIIGQLSIFDLIDKPKSIPVWLQEKVVEKRECICPVGTYVKHANGSVYVVSKSDYVSEYNSYYLFLKRHNGPAWDFGTALYEHKLEDFGFRILEEGEK